MTINRRALLGSFLAVPAVSLALPRGGLAAEPVPTLDQGLDQHPFLAFQDIREHGGALVTTVERLRPPPPAVAPTSPFEIAAYFNGKGRPERPRSHVHDIEQFKIVLSLEQPGPERFATVRAAEDAIFADLARMSVYAPYRGGTDVWHSDTIRVNRMSNLIAARTRRGAGNRVLIDRQNLSAFSRDRHFVPTTEPRQFGRWAYAGLVNDRIEVWTTDDPPTVLQGPRGVVVYRATPKSDGGHILTWDGRAYGLVDRMGRGLALANSLDFYGVVALDPTGEEYGHQVGWG